MYYLNEAATHKIEDLANKALEIPYAPINTAMDKLEHSIKKTRPGKRFLRRVYYDPSNQSYSDNAKEWAGLLAAGSLATHIPAVATGTISPMALGTVVAGNALKGAATGPLLTGGTDNLTKATLVPAGVMLAATPAINAIGNSLGQEDDIDFMPEARAGAVGATGAGMWALRNRKNKNRQYY